MVSSLLILTIPYITTLRVTAYCDYGLTASGCLAGPGQCAAPSWVPFGSTVVVRGVSYRVTDRTARRFRHNTVDLWMPRRYDCMKHGVKHAKVLVYPAGSRNRSRHSSHLLGGSPGGRPRRDGRQTVGAHR